MSHSLKLGEQFSPDFTWGLLLKAGSVPEVKVVQSVNADTILVAINMRSNTNINEGNKANQWDALQMLLHVWSYDFYDIGYFTE